MMNTIEWICTYCSLLTKNKLNIFIYFQKNMKKILRYFTPAQEKFKNLTYPPIHKNKKCLKCKKMQEYCENIKYGWFCQCCDLEQVKLSEDKVYIIINSHEKTQLKNLSSVIWQCKNCSKLQLSFSMIPKKRNK